MIEPPWQHVRVRFMEMEENWLNGGRIFYHLNITDIRRFIEWTELNYPDIDIQARYQKMEKCEKTEKLYDQGKGRVIIKDDLNIVGTPQDIMMLKLSCPFPSK